MQDAAAAVLLCRHVFGDEISSDGAPSGARAAPARRRL